MYWLLMIAGTAGAAVAAPNVHVGNPVVTHVGNFSDRRACTEAADAASVTQKNFSPSIAVAFVCAPANDSKTNPPSEPH
jgi:hypothetical protein